MRYIILITTIAVLLSLTACQNSEFEGENRLRKMIGQMLIIGFRGTEIGPSSPITHDLAGGNIGGVILFDYDVELQQYERNIESPEQVKSLINDIKNYALTPPFIAIDQEGGKISRLKERYGFPTSVSQQYLGELNNPDSTRFYARRCADTLCEMGFNLNFAPVVDLNVNPDSPAIGALERSFSVLPSKVITHSEIVIEEHRNKNIYNCLKHFPGHGSAQTDSHLGFTDVTDTWSEEELIPYQSLVSANKADFIMTAHIFNSQIDSLYPATLSQKTITGILRDEIGFDGVIVSDDMNMSAITEHYSLKQAIKLSLDAGVDVLVFANNLVYDEDIATKVIDIIVDLLEEDKISYERIEKSYRRIIRKKEKVGIF